MWIVCLADDSHEMSSLMFFEKYKIRMSFAEVLYTKVSDKMTYAYSANPDQTTPEGAVWSVSTLFAIPL